MQNTTPPIVLFAYARPDTTAKVVESIRQQIEPAEELIVFIDKPKPTASQRTWDNHNACIQLINAIDFIKTTLIVREENHGCRKNIITGLDYVFSNYTSAAVLEDDIVASPYFYQYIKSTLQKYQADEKVFSISAYANLHSSEIKRFAPRTYKLTTQAITTDCFNSNRFWCWGWATWANRWQQVRPMYNNDKSLYSSALHIPKTALTYDLVHLYREYQVGKSNSWAIPLTVYTLKHGYCHIVPVKSLVNNIGFGVEEATHTVNDNPLVNKALDFEFYPTNFAKTTALPACIAQKVSPLFMASYIAYKLLLKLQRKLKK